MKIAFPYTIGLIVTVLIMIAIDSAFPGDYKAYQNRNLTTTLSLNTELSEERIEYLVNLPRNPKIIHLHPGESVKLTHEFFLLSEDETIGAHFNGCEGVIIFNLNIGSKY